MFHKLFKGSRDKPRTVDTPITAAATGPSLGEKKSLYRRFQDSKRGELKEEDILKYTGRKKADIVEWSKTAPGVGGNQLAGKLDMGGTSGLGGVAAAEGYGGWGWDANSKARFPPGLKPGDDAEKTISEGNKN